MFNPHWNLITVKRGEMRPAPLHVPTPHPRPELSNQTSLSQYLLFIPTENHGETICALDSRVVIYNKIIIILLIAITCIMTRRLVGICTGHETVNTLSFVLPETKEGSGHLGCSMLTHVPRSRWGQWWLEMEAGVKIPGNDDTLPGSRDSGGEDDGAGRRSVTGVVSSHHRVTSQPRHRITILNIVESSVRACCNSQNHYTASFDTKYLLWY